MAHDVFISLSSHDKPISDAVCAGLEAHRIRCWVAPRDIAPGAEWAESIIEAINEARCMVLVFSGHANASPQVRREVERAVSKGIPVIPVRIEDVPPSKTLEYFISTPHWLDAFTPPLEQHLNRLAQAIRIILDQSATRQSPSMETRPATPETGPSISIRPAAANPAATAAVFTEDRLTEAAPKEQTAASAPLPSARAMEGGTGGFEIAEAETSGAAQEAPGPRQASTPAELTDKETHSARAKAPTDRQSAKSSILRMPKIVLILVTVGLMLAATGVVIVSRLFENTSAPVGADQAFSKGLPPNNQGATGQSVTAPGGVAVGRDVKDSPITIGSPPQPPRK